MSRWVHAQLGKDLVRGLHWATIGWIRAAEVTQGDTASAGPPTMDDKAEEAEPTRTSKKDKSRWMRQSPRAGSPGSQRHRRAQRLAIAACRHRVSAQLQRRLE